MYLFGWLLALLSLATMTGCGAVFAIAQHEVLTGAGVASYVFTGKSLLDHAAGKITNKDCSLIGGVLSSKRKICEPLDSEHAQSGFRGIVAMLDKNNLDETTIIAPAGAPSLRLSDTIAKNKPDGQLQDKSMLTTHSPANLRFSESVSSRQAIAATGHIVTYKTVSVASATLTSFQ